MDLVGVPALGAEIPELPAISVHSRFENPNWLIIMIMTDLDCVLGDNIGENMVVYIFVFPLLIKLGYHIDVYFIITL